MRESVRSRQAWVTALCMIFVVGCGPEASAPSEPAAEPSPGGPASVEALAFRQISTRGTHTCGVTTADEAFCWGENGSGQLGDGSRDMRLAPVRVSGGLAFRQVASGTGFTCALSSNDRAYCWGSGYGGEPGFTTVPLPFAGERRFRQLSAGSSHACAVTAAGIAFCWGDNTDGELGDGTRTPRTEPVRVQAGTLRFREVSAGTSHTCGVTLDDRAYCWGYNGDGALGDGTTDPRLTPVAVNRGLRFRQVRAGGSHTCGVTTDDLAYCWGASRYGALGDGSSGYAQRRVRPSAVLGGLRFRSVIPGSLHTCGVTTDDRPYCWGSLSHYAPLGTVNNKTTPFPVPGGLRFRKITAGADADCGVTPDNRGYCWGSRTGDGTSARRTSPVPVAGPI